MQHLHPEAPALIRVFLAIHIAAGSVALFVVPIVLAVRKGGKTHRRLGMAYVYAMGVVALTAFVVGPYFHDYFLLLIAIFSSYLTFCGWRILARKRPEKQPAAAIDWAGASLAAGAGLTMIGMGVFAHAFFADFSIVLFVLGAICTGAGVRSMIGFVRPPAERSAWLFEHFSNMLAAYIATVTAFSAVNFTFIHPIWVRWLWPTVAGTILITYYTTRYKTAIARGAPTRTLVTVREPETIAV
jgi:uncharacterized membrane protein